MSTNPAPRFPPHEVIDRFLPGDLHRQLLAHTLASEDRFVPSKVTLDGGDAYDHTTRHSFLCQGRLGPLTDVFSARIEALRPALLAALGIPEFAVARVELELAAHRHGSFFQPHADILTARSREDQATDRVLTLVYYFHANPRRFSGGELALYAFGSGEHRLLEPADNRLIAFPSFAVHEVRPVKVPDGDAFADARFAVNCWLHRARPGQPKAENA